MTICTYRIQVGARRLHCTLSTSRSFNKNREESRLVCIDLDGCSSRGLSSLAMVQEDFRESRGAVRAPDWMDGSSSLDPHVDAAEGRLELVKASSREEFPVATPPSPSTSPCEVTAIFCAEVQLKPQHADAIQMQTEQVIQEHQISFLKSLCDPLDRLAKLISIEEARNAGAGSLLPGLTAAAQAFHVALSAHGLETFRPAEGMLFDEEQHAATSLHALVRPRDAVPLAQLSEVGLVVREGFRHAPSGHVLRRALVQVRPRIARSSGTDATCADHAAPEEGNPSTLPSGVRCIHELKATDTLQGVALRYGLSVTTLTQFNRLPANNHAIGLRTELLIPTSSAASQPGPQIRARVASTDARQAQARRQQRRTWQGASSPEGSDCDSDVNDSGNDSAGCYLVDGAAERRLLTRRQKAPKGIRAREGAAPGSTKVGNDTAAGEGGARSGCARDRTRGGSGLAPRSAVRMSTSLEAFSALALRWVGGQRAVPPSTPLDVTSREAQQGVMAMRPVAPPQWWEEQTRAAQSMPPYSGMELRPLVPCHALADGGATSAATDSRGEGRSCARVQEHNQPSSVQ